MMTEPASWRVCSSCGFPTYSPPGVRCTSKDQHDWPPSLTPAERVEQIVARLVELDVPESALTPVRQWIKENR